MYKLLLPFVLSFLFLSCSKSDDNKTDSNTNYIVYPNATLLITEGEFSSYLEVGSGNNLVFEYKFSTEGNPDIADDEYTEVVYFELDTSTDDFLLQAEDFAAAKAYVGRFCFCVNTGFFKIEAGEISGIKTGNLKWNVSLDVEAYSIPQVEMPAEVIDVNTSGIFEPQN